MKEFRIRVKTEQLAGCSINEHTVPIIPTLAEISNWRGGAKKLHEAEPFFEKIIVHHLFQFAIQKVKDQDI